MVKIYRIDKKYLFINWFLLTMIFLGLAALEARTFILGVKGFLLLAITMAVVYILNYCLVMIKLVDQSIIYYAFGIFRKIKINISDIANIYYTPRLKLFNAIFESISVIYTDAGGIKKELEIKIGLFNLKDLAQIIKEFLITNPVIKLDSYCQSLISGEYFNKQAKLSAQAKNKIKQAFPARQMLRGLIIGIAIFAAFIAAFIIYFSLD